jgi:uncharacterized protein (TIGR03083 family)
VRDVAAHCIETQLMTPGRFIGRFAGTAFRFNAFNTKGVTRHGSESTADLLKEYSESAPHTTAPPGPVVTWLAEAVIHGQDMARPIGKTVTTSPEALTTVASWVITTTPLLHGKQRSAGLTLRATDADWSAGEGPEVSGPITSIILAVSGRKAALADLSGAGLETLRPRLS